MSCWPRQMGQLGFTTISGRWMQYPHLKHIPWPESTACWSDGEAVKYVSTLDLTKSLSLTKISQEKITFQPLPFQYYATFSLHRATATFQLLMDTVLQPHSQYEAAYIDNIVYSCNWKKLPQTYTVGPTGPQKSWPHCKPCQLLVGISWGDIWNTHSEGANLGL